MRNDIPYFSRRSERIFTRHLLTAWMILLLHSAAAFSSVNPHIIIILVDDMGYGDLACFNPESKIPTPQIDRLAASGMRFTDAHAPGPLCHVSRYGLLTGRYPFRTTFEWQTEPVIKPDEVTIASFLKTQGYQTAMVGKWHLGFKQDAEDDYTGVLAGGPIDCGFESFFGIRASTDIPPYFYIRGERAVMPPTSTIEANNSEGWFRNQGKFWRGGAIAPDLKLDEVLPRFTEEAIGVIRDYKASKTDSPLLLYLAYPAPHTPWLPSKEFVGSTRVDLYGDFMHMVDAHVGLVLSALEDADMTKDTLVIFTSDNGPTWYAADRAKYGHDSAGPLRGMKGDAWEGGHRMPFIASWPGCIQAASTSAQTICFTDLLATFADITNTELPANAGADSFSVYPVLVGEQAEDDPIRGPIVMAANNTMLIRSGDWKLIDSLRSGGFSQEAASSSDGATGQLYNLKADPGERNNLWLHYPERVAELSEQLAQIKRESKTRN